MMLGALKGAPLSCLIAMGMVHPSTVTQTWLCQVTRYNSDSVARGMGTLDTHQLAWRVDYKKWGLTSGGVQLAMELPKKSEVDGPRYGQVCIDEKRPCAARAKLLVEQGLWYLEKEIHIAHPDGCQCEQIGCMFGGNDGGDWIVQAEIELWKEMEGAGVGVLVNAIRAVMRREKECSIPPSHRKKML